jgi:hypothetical protein
VVHNRGRRRAARAIAGIAALCCLLLTYGGDAAAKGTDGIRPFKLVEVGKTVFHFAAGGRSVSVQVDTSPPTVCAIAYGKKPSLGSIADDPNMGGTAISQHTIVLSGLSPGTTYFYKLTATDARAAVFQTPGLASFTTPRQAASHERDVAIGAKVVFVSSQWSSAYKAENAVDGNLSSQWASNNDGNHAWITIDLRRAYKVNGVAFITRQMTDGSAITKTFAVVVDGHRRYGPFPAGNGLDPRVARVSFTARLIRFEVVTSTGGNTGATEVEVFSPS